jgi:hypothetical protein
MSLNKYIICKKLNIDGSIVYDNFSRAHIHYF